MAIIELDGVLLVLTLVVTGSRWLVTGVANNIMYGIAQLLIIIIIIINSSISDGYGHLMLWLAAPSSGKRQQQTTSPAPSAGMAFYSSGIKQICLYICSLLCSAACRSIKQLCATLSSLHLHLIWHGSFYSAISIKMA